MNRVNIFRDVCIVLGLTQIDNSWVKTLGAHLGVEQIVGDDYEQRVFVACFANGTSTNSGSVEVFAVYGDFPATGQDETLYVTKDTNVIYRWDTPLNTYVILNDPDVVNPDAPEEGGTFYVKLATTTALNPCTYNNGTAGVGATLTGNSNGILGEIQFVNKIDNTTAVLGDVILVKNQTLARNNGIYEVTQLGSAGAVFILTRIDGYDETDEIYPSIVFVSAGAGNANRYFTQSTSNPTIGTSSLVYSVAASPAPALPVLFVDSVTTAALPAVTYTAGTTYASLPGYNATLRANANGALGTINGVPMISGYRLIVRNQVTTAHNGVYTVTNAGSATARFVLTRLVYDANGFYKAREFEVTHILSTEFGSRWTITSPLTMTNANWGVTGIAITRSNRLQDILSSGASSVMLDSQSIISDDTNGEFKIAYNYGAGKESYIYRAQDGSSEARVGLYTDDKGMIIWDTTATASNKIDLYANDGDIDIHTNNNDQQFYIDQVNGVITLFTNSNLASTNKVFIKQGENGGVSAIVYDVNDNILGGWETVNTGETHIVAVDKAVQLYVLDAGLNINGIVEVQDTGAINLDNNSNFIKIDAIDNNTITIYAQGDVDITADNGVITTNGVLTTNGNIILNNFTTMQGGSDGGFELSTNKLDLGNANPGDDDYSWSLGNGAGAIVSFDMTDALFNNAIGLIRIEANDGVSGGYLLIEPGANGINLNHDTYVTIGNNNGNNGIEMDGTDLSMYATGNGTLFINDANGIRLSPTQAIGNGNKISVTGLPVYDTDVAAGIGGLTTDMLFKTTAGALMVKA